MRDQATELRNLVRRSLQQQTPGDGVAPRLLLATGGKGGVGTTTLAVNLSVAMALNGWRVVLVDADLCQADVAPLCGLSEQASITDILAARRDIHEVIQLGPAGVQVIPGLWAHAGSTDVSEARQQRLINQLRALRRHADMVVLDVGNGSTEIVRRFWQAADEVILVTTPDSVAVMDSYATIKLTLAAGVRTPVRVLVNQVEIGEQGADVFHRIDQCCRKFLQLGIGYLGSVRSDRQACAAASAGLPLLIHAPDSSAARQIHEAAATLCREMENLLQQKHEAA